MVKDNIEQEIVKILEDNSDGLTINQVSEKANLYRATASKYLMLLEAQGVVQVREIGPAKLYILKDNVREIVRKMERQENVKKDWIDNLIGEIKSEVKEEIK